MRIIELGLRVYFSPKVRIDILTKHYRIYTVTTEQELAEVLELRSRCIPSGPVKATEYDYRADHLIVRSLSTHKICGSYSVICSEYSDFFESAEDFDIASILAKPGCKLELAWACIDPDKRDGIVISLLWRGIAELIRATKASLVFGVTSLFDSDEMTLHKIQNYLNQGVPLKAGQRALPALLRAYMRAGASVWREPVFDRAINCYDFMTVLEIKNCPRSLEHHFHL